MATATSRATVVVDNKTLRSKAGASMQMGGVTRKPAMTDQLEVYNTEEVIPGQIKCVMPHMADTDLPALRNFKNGTVHYTTNTGKVYTMANAFFVSMGDLQNGEVEVTFAGDPIK